MSSKISLINKNVPDGQKSGTFLDSLLILFGTELEKSVKWAKSDQPGQQKNRS
jgi:hypothetical protein